MNIVNYGNHVSYEDIVLFLCCISPLFIAGLFLVAMIRIWLKGRFNVHYPTRHH